MMKTRTNKTRLLFQLVFLLLSQISFAQGPVFEEDVIDVPSAPINDWLIPTSIIAMVMFFYIFKKTQREE